MTRDTYDITLRRASQISHKLDIIRSSPSARRASKVSTYTAKRTLLREDFEGSERTLVASSLDSNNSSRSNINTAASSSSYYTNSTTDVGGSERADDDDDADEDEDDTNGRGKHHDEVETDKSLWEKHYHYILLSFGAVFGFGNIMTFPALAMEHGGGAFLLTYIFLTFTVGLPIVYLEVSLGQYARGGVYKTWRIMPLARGIAVCSLLVTFIRSCYSSTPVVWSLYYLYSAIIGTLPGSRPVFGEIHSVIEIVNNSQTSNLTVFYHRQLYNDSHNFFFSSTLEVTESISSMGYVVPKMIVSLLLVWAMIFWLCALGPRFIGKISILLTAIPSILLGIILVAVLVMPGSVVGIQSLLNPRWHHLANVKPWLDVLDFVLSSMSCGSGILITLSGHCHFHDNTFRSAISLTLMSITMTTVSGCLMFSLLGAESRLAGIHVHRDNMTRLSNVELGFVLLPTVVTDLPATRLWSCMFYLALVLLGLVQAALMIYTFQQGVIDMSHLEKAGIRWKMAILGAVIIVVMTLNIFTTAQNGLYIFQLLQYSVTRICTPLICATQCIIVGWGYGARRFAGRITEMTGRNKSFVWKWSWRWGCPVLLSLIVIASVLTVNLLHDLPPKDKNKKWLYGVAMAISPIILLPGITIAAVAFFKVYGNMKQRLKMLRSTPCTWGPGHPEHEPQADLPDYVICHPDPFRPANALAMLTANLYLPNIVNFVNMQSSGPKQDLVVPSFISDVGTLTSSEDETSMGSPASKNTTFFTRCQATISCLSHVVGLGNVVRFPYLAYRHGGGAFLIAYIIVLVTCGIPLVILETAIGQFSNLGPITVWRAVPIFKGLGYSMVLVSTVSSVYYSVITSWCMYYLATSLTSVLPWQHCANNWNTNSCRPHDLLLKLCHAFNETDSDNSTNLLCFNPDDPTCNLGNQNLTSHCSEITVPNVNSGLNNGSLSPSHEYFYLAVLKMSTSWGQPGEVRWQLMICLLLIWIVVTLFLLKCCKPGRKITYLVLLLTCTVLIVLLIRASSLTGGHDGLNLLFTPMWSRLTEAHVWRDAVSQVFFSLSLGSGTLIVMGTYNKFSNDLFREAMLVCIIDGAVSLLSSLVIFAMIGAIAHAAGQTAETAAQADLGLSFVALSTAALQLPWPLFWAILVFLVLVLLGIFTCVGAMATALTSLMDLLPPSLRKQRLWLLLGLCSGAAVLGMPMMAQVGFYIIDIIDTHVSGLPQACVGGLVCVAFSWVYGLSRLCRDIKRMNNSAVGCTWRLLWVVVCPCATAMLVLNSLASLTSSNNDLNHPWWTTTAGLILWLAMVAPIFAGIIHEIYQYKTAGVIERFRRSCQPKKEWGATMHRCSSLVEYYPTVHTHLGLDISREGLNTVADQVEFTTVGVRVPSLSQTTLLPTSPGQKRTKKPLDMRHKAILNHAYSNPQCDLSTGSLERIPKHKRYPMFLTRGEYHDVIIVKRPNKEVVTCDSSTQTEPNWTDTKLCRQRSQPSVHVSKPLPRMPRSSSWHQIGDQPAILEVNNTNQLDDANVIEEKKEPASIPPSRRRRHGQSFAPNLCLLIADEKSTPEDDNTSHPASLYKILESSCDVSVLEYTSQNSHENVVDDVHGEKEHATEEYDSSKPSVKGISCNIGSHQDSKSQTAAVLMSHSQPDIYARQKSKLRDSWPAVKGGRSKSVDETPANTHRFYDRYGPSKGVDNASFCGRTRSVSESGRIIKSTECRNLYHGVLDRASKRRGSNVIMEEEDIDHVEDQFDIDSRLQFIQSEAEVSKI